MKKLFNNPLGIRVNVPTTEKIILGLIPIVFILILWIITTMGSKEVIKLPEGIFEGSSKTTPAIGTKYTDRVRMSLLGWSLEYTGEGEATKTFIKKENFRFELKNLPSRKISNGVRITLPAGKIIARTPLQLASETTSLSASSTESLASQPQVISYRFEVIETRIFAPVILPSPAEVLRSFPSLWTDRDLPLNILYSFLRVAAGFLVAFLVVFPTTLLMGTFSKFQALLSPLMLFGGYLPIPALVPLTMCLFGTTEFQKIMFLALGFAIYLMPLFVKALEEVDNVYLQTGYTLGASKFQVMNKILLPIAMPQIFNSMRLGFGIGWGYIILAEMVDMGSKGVGTLILTSQRRGPREDIYLVLIAIVVMAFITDKIWEKVGKELFPYRSKER